MFAFTIAFVTGAQAPAGDATGARIGRWVDGNFGVAVGLTIGVCVALVLGVGLLLRAWGRQRRRNRRLRRHQEAVLARQLGILQRHVEELRGDVGQLAELQDHVVGQVQMLRAVISPSDDDALALAWAQATTASPAGAGAAPRELVGSSSAGGPPAEIDLRAPARLVETGEPMAWATEQPSR